MKFVRNCVAAGSSAWLPARLWLCLLVPAIFLGTAAAQPENLGSVLATSRAWGNRQISVHSLTASIYLAPWPMASFQLGMVINMAKIYNLAMLRTAMPPCQTRTTHAKLRKAWLNSSKTRAGRLTWNLVADR